MMVLYISFKKIRLSFEYYFTDTQCITREGEIYAHIPWYNLAINIEIFASYQNCQLFEYEVQGVGLHY